MAFDINRLRLGERIAGACAVLLFIDLFLNWYSANAASVAKHLGVTLPPGVSGGISKSFSAWTAFGWVDLLMLLTIIVVLGWIALAATQRTVALPIAASTIAAALCAFTTLVVLYRIINQPGPNDVIDVEYGAYLGLLLLLGMTYGTYAAMRAEGATFGQAGDKLRAAVESRTQPAPPRAAEPAPPGPADAAPPRANDRPAPPAADPPPPPAPAAAPPAQAPPPPRSDPPPAGESA
jgi:hypothetical protein